jgi:hypothetical protein
MLIITVFVFETYRKIKPTENELHLWNSRVKNGGRDAVGYTRGDVFSVGAMFNKVDSLSLTAHAERLATNYTQVGI